MLELHTAWEVALTAYKGSVEFKWDVKLHGMEYIWAHAEQIAKDWLGTATGQKYSALLGTKDYQTGMMDI